MKYVIDASVAAKWLVEDEGSPRARQVLSAGATLLAPELIVAEIANVAWKKLGRNEVCGEHALAMIRLLPRLLDNLATLAPLAEVAFTIARDLDHPAYDCLYLALAEREGAILVSDDRRLLSRLEGSPWRDRARSLSSFAEPLRSP